MENPGNVHMMMCEYCDEKPATHPIEASGLSICDECFEEWGDGYGPEVTAIEDKKNWRETVQFLNRPKRAWGSRKTQKYPRHKQEEL